MSYSRDLPYLLLLIRTVSAKPPEHGTTADELAKELGLEPHRVRLILNRYPTIFRRGGPDRRGPLYEMLLPARLLLGLAPRSTERADKGARYSLQKWGGPGAPEGGFVEFVEREAAAERGDTRTADSPAAHAAWGLIAALLVLVVALSLFAATSGRLAPSKVAGALQTEEPARPAAIPCQICQLPKPIVIHSPGPGPDGAASSAGWLRGLLIVIAAGAAVGGGVLLWFARAERPPAQKSLLSFGAALSFLGSAWAWVHPALAMKSGEELHNAVAAMLLMELAFSGLLLVCAIALGRLRWVWWLPALAFLGVLVAASWSDAARGALDHDLAAPYWKAPVPDKAYAALLVSSGAVGAVLSAIAAWFIAAWSRRAHA